MITRDSKNILVADDSEFFRVKLSDILTEAGHKAKFVNNGREVIEELQKNSDGFDLLMLDLQMPEVDGFGVLAWIRDNNFSGRFPVLAVTGVYEPTTVLDRLKSLGAAGLMTKAFSPEQVMHRVNRLLFPDKVVRGDPRVPISIPVDFTSEGSAHTGYLLNLSATGLFLHAKQKLQTDTIVTLKFSLPGSDCIMNVTGAVKWCTYLSGEENLFGGAGISFLDLTPKDQETLRQFVKAELEKLGLKE
ncbi:MAG: response regulator [Thermodesulfobacteriota bacterium]